MNNRGRRYDNDEKLNIKKVMAVVIALAVIIMFIIALTKLIGNVDNTGEKIIPINYFTIFTNGKWGVIDSKGETIIEPTYADMIQIPDKTKAVFVCTYDVNYDNNTYKTKVLNNKNEELYKDYELIETIQNFDESNNLWYESNVLKVKKDGKYGIISIDGKEIVSCQYENIEALNGVSNSLLTTKDGKKGLIDKAGSIIIDNNYKSIKPLSTRYEDGYIVENDEGKFGVINYNKKVALECKYESISNIYGDNKYVVKQDGTSKIIDTENKTYLEGKANNIKSINENNVIIENDSKYGIINLDGEEVVKPDYQELKYLFSDYYIAKKDNKYGVINTKGETQLEFNYTQLVYRSSSDILEGSKSAEESDLIDRNMQVKLTGIVSEVNNEKGYIKVRVNNEYKYYNFKFEEKSEKDVLQSNTLFVSKNEGKYGFVNKDGVTIVNYIYDDATEQNEYGYSAVKKDGLWGVINQKSEVIVEPKYKLENNTIINFIGKWHIAEDLNANYYTDN